MGKTTASLLLLACTLTAGAVTKEVEAYQARMDQAQDLKDTIHDAIDAKDSKEVARLSHELTILLQQDEQYWEKQQISDALALSKTSVQLSKTIEAAAREGDIPQSIDAYQKLQITCRSCHDAHPEKWVTK